LWAAVVRGNHHELAEGLSAHAAAAAAGLTFAAQYFVCRVLIGNYFWWVMIKAAIDTPSPSVSVSLHVAALHKSFKAAACGRLLLFALGMMEFSLLCRNSFYNLRFTFTFIFRFSSRFCVH
jgi:hypothetical protein